LQKKYKPTKINKYLKTYGVKHQNKGVPTVTVLHYGTYLKTVKVNSVTGVKNKEVKIMIVKKYLSGEIVYLDVTPIKNYKRFILYQISRVIQLGQDVKLIPLYKECFTPNQLKEIVDKKFFIREEVKL